MAERICYVSGSQEEFDLICEEANVRFGKFKSGKWEITIRVPECNFKVSPYRYSRCRTIKGLYNKLKRNKLNRLVFKFFISCCIFFNKIKDFFNTNFIP